MYSSTLSQQARFKTGLARDPNATAVESPFNIPLMSSFTKLFNLTGAEIWEAPDEWWKSREKDIQLELPKQETPSEFPKVEMANNQLLRFVLVVLLAYLISKRL